MVFGAGISGLSAAYRLHEAGRDVLVLESSTRVGGSIYTVRHGDYLLEIGPNSYSQKPDAEKLVHDIGLSDDLIETPLRDHKRFVFDGERLQEVPTSLLGFAKTSLVSTPAKMRVMREPFLRKPPPAEESVADFIRRHLGQEILDMFVAPFVSGIYAGDPETMSMPAALPLQYGFARDKGSMIRGAMTYLRRKGKNTPPSPAGKRKPRALCSFQEGLQQFPEALIAKIGRDRVLHGVQFDGIQWVESYDGEPPHFVVRYTTAEGESREESTRGLLVATPAHAAAPLFRDWLPRVETALNEIEYLPLAVAHVATPSDSLEFQPDGFGFLIPRKKGDQPLGVRALGVLWTGSVFPDRAPAGMELQTMFYGGATDREGPEMSDGDFERHIREDLGRTLGWNGTGEILRLSRYDKALPAYKIGHLNILERIRAVIADVPAPVYLLGNYLGGISLPDCVKRAVETAADINRKLEGD